MASVERTKYQNIGIEDIDRALRDWFDERVDAYVVDANDELKKVPVIMASGERWATSRDERGIRDKNGVLILPLISIRRTGMVRQRDRSALGTEDSRLTIAKRIDNKTHLVQNAISSRTLPNRNRAGKIVYEITTIPFPDWFVTNYEIIVWAQYIAQMNDINEKIFDVLDIQNQFVMPVNQSEFKGNPNSDLPFDERKPLKGYYFVGFIEEDVPDSGNFEEFTDTERIVRYTFNVTVPSYLQLDKQGEPPAIQREYTSFDIKFRDENVIFFDDPYEIELTLTAPPITWEEKILRKK